MKKFATLTSQSRKLRRKLYAVLTHNHQRRLSRIEVAQNTQTYYPSGVFPKKQAQLLDKGHFASSTGAVTSIPGGYTLGASGIPVFNLPAALTGNFWVVTRMADDAVNSYRPGFLGPTYTPEALRSRGGVQVWKHPAVAGSHQIRVIGGSTFAGDLLDLQAVPMGPTLALPSKLRIGLGQSPGTGVDTAGPYAWSFDGWLDPRAMYCTGSANSAYGTTIGGVTGMCQPLQSAGMSGATLVSNLIRNGVSPYGAAVNGLMDRTPETHNSILVQAAVSGAGFAAADAPWNSVGSNPVAWNNYIAQMNALGPQLVAGSSVDLIFFAGGEAETAADMAFFPAAFDTFMGRVTTDLITRGLAASQPPVVIINVPPDCVVANRDKVRTVISQMDSQSGHANSRAWVHVVETGSWGLVDATHRTNAANRQAGAAVAALIKARNLI